MKFFTKLTLSLLSGGLLAFPFFEHCPVLLSFLWPFFGLALLLKIFSRSSAKSGFFYGWLVGFVFFGLGVSWVYVSIHDFGNVPIFESAGITASLALFLGLFYGLHGYLLNRFFQPISWRYFIFAFPILGILMELLKSVLFTGFPWLEIGITQLQSPLAGFAPIIGSYGVGGLVFFIVGLGFYAVRSRSLDPLRNSTCVENSGVNVVLKSLLTRVLTPVFRSVLPCSFSSKANFSEGFFILLVFIVLILVSGQILKSHSWTKPMLTPLTVSLVQGNIPQSIKWDEENVILSLEEYAQLSKNLPESDVILWPETAIPADQIEAQAYLESLSRWLSKTRPHTTLITGIPYLQEDRQEYFNAAIAVGNGKGMYFKQHLVPFGEYVPLHSLFGVVFQFLNIPMSDFARGSSHQALLQAGPYSIATFICYESAFSGLVRQSARNANLLVVLSDDTWFGNSAGPYQHLQINQMRALENGRYVLSVTNNGITAVIDPHGRVVKRIPPFERNTLTTEIFPESGKTPYEI